MPSRSFSTTRLSLVLCVALIACLAILVGLDYEYNPIAFFFTSFSTAGNMAKGQVVKQSPVCALDRQMDWLAQSTNQTPTTTNLLLVCPGVAVALKDHQHQHQESHVQSSLVFTRRLRTYIAFQLQQKADPCLEWIFFLKDHETLFSHTPRSLRNFIHHATSETHVLIFPPAPHGTRSTSTGINPEAAPLALALGLFAIRIDPRSVRLLDLVLELLEQQQSGLFETGGAIMTAQAAISSYNAASTVVVVPEWWLEVRSNCVERATWEAQFGVTRVVPTDRLCCVSDFCRDALNKIATPRELPTSGEGQIVDPQISLDHDSDLSVEHIVEAFWRAVRHLELDYDPAPPFQFADEGSAAETVIVSSAPPFEFHTAVLA
ncbi:hypothetical protein LTR99_006517 [Exophiala xenobiotica]|uniref:Uncharacterized protein n=1 Tax=Vermiconidia calcicola TaxID=1690605 RepID=A0AAV9Q7P9_9PEZI|nr:hypothetical protein LTR41_006557 [Exophiala xenobiotica]KAK5535625.1 hypothetical protein LTR23_008219 [Chaetothyriales sp. CCFEE 6169]KAK5537687.1 hypothetical protein LTR25_004939 [Vermiconidia calcicola]KAK5219101.1 hypothetical protein LTR72_008283 [Exophiala xenobiotica]KAK5235404.1 hypothetical protein LTR47_003589 [Exophiala xenobiotica]